MLKKLLAAWPLPQAKDLATNEPSFRLWAVWWSFHTALASVIALHFWAVSAATWTSIAFYGLTMVFYMLKKLTKAKIDLDDQSLEFEDSQKEEEKA